MVALKGACAAWRISSLTAGTVVCGPAALEVAPKVSDFTGMGWVRPVVSVLTAACLHASLLQPSAAKLWVF